MEEDNFIHYIDENESDTQAAANRYRSAIDRLYELYNGSYLSAEPLTAFAEQAVPQVNQDYLCTISNVGTAGSYSSIEIRNPEIESMRQEIAQLKADVAELKKILRNTIDNSFTPEHRKITL